MNRTTGRLGKVVAGLVALAAGCAPRLGTAGETPGSGSRDAGPVHPIAEVATLAELAGQPLIELAGGAKVRLGVESHSFSAYAGIFIYCLAEGYALPPPWRGGPHPFYHLRNNQCGPVFVSLRYGRGAAAPVETISGPATASTKPLLFTKAIMASRPGRIEVGVSGPDGRDLAATTVRVTSEGSHPWLPLRLMWAPGSRDTRMTRVEGRAVDHVAPYLAAAIPYRCGIHWVEVDQLTDGGAREPKAVKLPKLIPEGREPGLKLEMNGPLARITSESDIVQNYPARYFLARWWVNGKPIAPKLSQKPFGLLSLTEKAFRGRTAEFILDFDPGVLGAKKGDRIAFQVLYCWWGWIADGHQASCMIPYHGWVSDVPTLISNRADFALE